MRFIWVLAFVTLAIPCLGQTAGKAEIFPGKDITSQLTSLTQSSKSSGSGGATLGDYKSHAIKLSVRTASGKAEIHAHYDDIFFVTGGKATLTTGGNAVNAKAGGDGESAGSSIEGGVSQPISKGDVVHIPAGTPHQLTIANGDIFSAIVVKVKEPDSQLP